MPVALGLPAGYPWVMTAAAGSIFLHIFQITVVSKARKEAKIEYPRAYAEKEECATNKKAQIFNCAQRAHANTLENIPTYILSILLAGIKFPRVTVGLGAAWLLSRVIYTTGYSTGDPKKRSSGALAGTIVLLSLVGTATYALFQILAETNFEI